MSLILALRRFVEEIRAHNMATLFIFIDFKQDYDSAVRSNFLKILALYAIAQGLINTICLLYSSTREKILSEAGTSQ